MPALAVASQVDEKGLGFFAGEADDGPLIDADPEGAKREDIEPGHVMYRFREAADNLILSIPEGGPWRRISAGSISLVRYA